jgi:hypothetical protein
VLSTQGWQPHLALLRSCIPWDLQHKTRIRSEIVSREVMIWEECSTDSTDLPTDSESCTEPIARGGGKHLLTCPGYNAIDKPQLQAPSDNDNIANEWTASLTSRVLSPLYNRCRASSGDSQHQLVYGCTSRLGCILLPNPS